jgi:hypothetical protein
MTTSTSAYALCAPCYWERGWCVIPTMPGEKRPGEYRRGRWVGMTDWAERYRDRWVSRFEIQVWCNASDNPGIGLVCGRADHVVGIDLDSDDPTIRAAILSVVPATTFWKRGNKGETGFFKGVGIESKSFNIGTSRVLDVLSDGRFCVLPSSLHPDTGQPYVWTGPDTFADYSPGDLPEIAPEHIAAIGQALKPFGYAAEPERAVTARERSGTGGGPWRRVNDVAMTNLDKWVPQLGLYRCQRTRDGFKAVATWRPSNTGRRPEKRKQNLFISRRGITDFGNGPKGYSPIDLVMAASGCEFWDAFDWLESLVDPPAFTIDLKAISASYDRKRAAARSGTTTPKEPR